MKRLFLSIIACILTLSTIYASISVSIAGKSNSALVDLSVKLDSEVEVFDIRLLTSQLNAEILLDLTGDRRPINDAEKLNLINFQEVPIPPPKS